MKIIPLSGFKGEGLSFSVSDEDVGFVLSGLSWYLGTRYVCGRGVDYGRPKSLHSFLLPNKDIRFVVDHIDNDYFNNQRDNLQILLVNENKRKRRVGGIDGVWFSPINNKWITEAPRSGSNSSFIGFSTSQEEAGEMRRAFISGAWTPKWVGRYKDRGRVISL
jgi:hypothetical protein